MKILEAVVAARGLQKHAWGAQLVNVTADRHGTAENVSNVKGQDRDPDVAEAEGYGATRCRPRASLQ